MKRILFSQRRMMMRLYLIGFILLSGAIAKAQTPHTSLYIQHLTDSLIRKMVYNPGRAAGVLDVMNNSKVSIISPVLVGSSTVGYVLTATNTGGLGSWQAPGGGDMILASSQTNTGAKTFLDNTLLIRNVANSNSSRFTNTNTGARVYSLPDFTGRVFASGGTNVMAGDTEYDGVSSTYGVNYNNVKSYEVTSSGSLPFISFSTLGNATVNISNNGSGNSAFINLTQTNTGTFGSINLTSDGTVNLYATASGGISLGGSAVYLNTTTTSNYPVIINSSLDIFNGQLTALTTGGSGLSVTNSNVSLTAASGVPFSFNGDDVAMNTSTFTNNSVTTHTTTNTFNAATTFLSSTLKIRNPANTFSYTIVPGAIGANRNITLPALGGNDTFAFLGATQTFGSGSTWNGVAVGTGFGGSGQTTVQASMNTFAGAVTNGSYLRGNGTNVVMSAIQAGDVPTLNQNTTGSAAKWTTARNLAGNSVDGSANVTFANKFIVQGTSDAGLSAAQFLGSLGNGLVKNTTTTGVLSIATAGTDYQAPITLTTTGSSGPATFISNTLNIPQYTASGGDIDSYFKEATDFYAAVQSDGFSWVSNGTGAATTTSNYGINSTEKASGVISITTGTTTTGETHHFKGYGAGFGDAYLHGNGMSSIMRWRVAFDAVSDGTNTYFSSLGFGGQINSKDQTDGIYFTYTHSTNSGKWQAVTASGGTRTSTDTGVAAGTSYQSLEIRTNAAGTSVEFYIDGSLVATNTTNIPTTTATAIFITMNKSAGTTSRVLYMDYYSLETTRTTAR